MRNFERNVKKAGTIMKVVGIITLVLSVVLLFFQIVKEIIPTSINIAFSIACIIIGKRISDFDDRNIGKYLVGCLLMLVLMSLVTWRIGGILTIIAYVNVIFGLDSFYRLNKYHNIKETLKKKKYSFINNAILVTSIIGFNVACIWQFVI